MSTKMFPMLAFIQNNSNRSPPLGENGSRAGGTFELLREGTLDLQKVH